MVDPVSETGRRWHFDWRLLVFAGLFLPLLVALGIWQLQRAEEKQALLLQWQQQATELGWPEQLAAGVQEGQPVTLTGQYTDRTWLLDNRTRDGAAGYEVLTLFQPREGRPIVVNRGWVLAPRRRDELPAITTPPDTVELSGRLHDYPLPPVLMETRAEGQTDARRVQSLGRQQVTRVAPEVAPLILRLAGPHEPGAYQADWAPDRMGPQTHYGYAVQWFSLAVALVILTLVASYRKSERKDDNG